MSNQCIMQETMVGEFEGILLSNGLVQVEVVPALGGKLTSLKHVATGREWLWHNPHLPLQAVEYDASYVERYDTGGLDECFPAVSRGEYPSAPWEGVMIPDHGELWCQPWLVEQVEASKEQIILTMNCHGVRFPYRFQRTVTLRADSPALKLSYEVTNLTTFDMPFVWSIHPILKIEAGMQIILPEAIDSVRLDGDIYGLLGEAGEWVSWPYAASTSNEEIDISRVPAADFRQAIKLYTPPIWENESVETAVIDPSGNHSLTFHFNPREISHIGLWLNYGGWSGSGSAPYFNLGLEPCIGGTDSLNGAINLDEYGLLQAKETRHWTLELVIK